MYQAHLPEELIVMNTGFKNILVVVDDAMWRTRVINGLGPFVNVYMLDEPIIAHAKEMPPGLAKLDAILVFPKSWMAMDDYCQFVVDVREAGFADTIMTASDDPDINRAMQTAGCSTTARRDNAASKLLTELAAP